MIHEWIISLHWIFSPERWIHYFCSKMVHVSISNTQKTLSILVTSFRNIVTVRSTISMWTMHKICLNFFHIKNYLQSKSSNRQEKKFKRSMHIDLPHRKFWPLKYWGSYWIISNSLNQHFPSNQTLIFPVHFGFRSQPANCSIAW